MSDSDDDGSKEITVIHRVPLLPLRDTVVFPHMVVPLFVGREKSIGALEEATAPGSEKEILLSAQRRARTDEPVPDDIHSVGTLSTVIQLLRLPDGTIKVLVEGKRRAVIRQFVKTDGFFEVEVEPLPDQGGTSPELEALVREVSSTFETYVKLNKRIAPEILASVQSIEDPSQLADTIAGQVPLKLVDKQLILEMRTPYERLMRLYELVRGEIEVLQAERKIRSRVKRQGDKIEREGFGSAEMTGLPPGKDGDKDEFKNEINELEERAASRQLPAEAAGRVKKELKKLRLMAPMSAEAAVVRNYLDWVLGLPWGVYTQDKLDVNEAERILDEEHYGLKRVKERILEYLAVQALVR
jgi:ATP-dependent Lon protease